MQRTTTYLLASALLASLVLAGCTTPEPSSQDGASSEGTDQTMKQNDAPRDPHSYARPHEVAVEHLSLDLEVDFDAKRLVGRASLTLDRPDREQDGPASSLLLDTRDLEIRAVTLDDDQAEVAFTLDAAVPNLGSRLEIPISPETRVVHIAYSTSPRAAAVQWLAPAQTAGGAHPFLFTQSQAILARTWVPCQDTPAVRMTYDAVVRVPSELMAVMSADGNPTERNAEGVYRFDMPQPIPSYLLALAVGDLAFAELGPRTGVYAEGPMLDASANEFADTESMLTEVEALFGPYRWGRYDLLVLPPSFPFGGMENPRLTFATPTIIAGDRSLVSLVAHELAHSWSGNLVTNATWNDFWLNEGFTVYLERRIMEAIRGRDYADMLAVLGRQDLEATVADLGDTAADTHLFLDLDGRDPDDGMTDIAYEKGYFFLRAIEEAVGRERFDPFLRKWFDENAFSSETTDSFLAYLDQALLADDPALAEKVATSAWVYGPGLPDRGNTLQAEAFVRVDDALGTFLDGAPPTELTTDGWSTHEWLHFLRGLPDDLSNEQMAALDQAFGLTASGNSEILHAWLHHVIASGYEPGYERLRTFLEGVGRRKFLKPLYERLAGTEEGKAMARDIYARARPGYHTVASATIDEILDWSPTD